MNRRDRRAGGPNIAAGAHRAGHPDHHGASAEPEAVAWMRAHPGEWRIVEEGAPKPLVKMGRNYGWLKAHPVGFEVAERDGIPGNPVGSAVAGAMFGGLVTVYARWVGERGEHATETPAAGEQFDVPTAAGLPIDAPAQLAAALGLDDRHVSWDATLDLVALVRSWGRGPA